MSGSGVSLDEFENLLNLWSTFFVLDDYFYLRIISELDLNSLDPIVTYEYIIRFLELWGVRRASTQLNPITLYEKIVELKPVLNKFNISLLQADLVKHEVDIKHIFREISLIRYVGPTSASKILHLLKPRFFVMWDRNIAKYYGFDLTANGYFEFLRKMKRALSFLLEEYTRKYSCRNPEEDLSKQYGGKPLTKLIDEYNWLKTRPWLNRLINLVSKYRRRYLH